MTTATAAEPRSRFTRVERSSVQLVGGCRKDSDPHAPLDGRNRDGAESSAVTATVSIVPHDENMTRRNSRFDGLADEYGLVPNEVGSLVQDLESLDDSLVLLRVPMSAQAALGEGATVSVDLTSPDLDQIPLHAEYPLDDQAAPLRRVQNEDDVPEIDTKKRGRERPPFCFVFLQPGCIWGTKGAPLSSELTSENLFA